MVRSRGNELRRLNAIRKNGVSDNFCLQTIRRWCLSQLNSYSLVRAFRSLCERRKLRVNTEKGKGVAVGREGVAPHFEAEMKSEIMGIMSFFKNLIICFSECRKLQESVKVRGSEGLITFCAYKKMCKVSSVCLNVKKELYERMFIPTVMLRKETWSI